MKTASLLSPKNLKICEKPKPVAGNEEAVIKIRYAGICGSDITVYKGEHPTATLPVIPGHEIIGTIESINSIDPGFKTGDRVVVDPLISCGKCEACIKGHKHVCSSLKLLGIHEDGGFAEYVKVSSGMLVKVPQALSDEVAALCEPFAVGYHVSYRSGIRAGDTVLIIGAGTIGMVLALVMREAGGEVYISEINKKRIELAREFGFNVIDAGKTDTLEEILRATDGFGVDVVCDASGTQAGALLMTKACKIRGVMIPMGLSSKSMEFELGKVSFKEMTLVGSRVYEHYHFLRGVRMLEAISKQYDLARLSTECYTIDEIQKGIDDMLNGRNTGKILIRYE